MRAPFALVLVLVLAAGFAALAYDRDPEPRASAPEPPPDVRAPADSGVLRLRGSLELPEELARPEVADLLRLEVLRADAPEERLDRLAWADMSVAEAVGEHLRLFTTRPLPEGEYLLALSPLGARFPVSVRAGAAPVELIAPRPARTLVEARDPGGAPIELGGARATRFEPESNAEPRAGIVLPLAPGEAEVLSLPGRLHVALPGRGWWPRGGSVEVEPGWNHLELRPRRSTSARVALLEHGAPRAMPLEWIEDIGVEPLDGAGEVLGRGFGDVTREGARALLLDVSKVGDYRLRLPAHGAAPERSAVVHVAGGVESLELALDSH